MHHIEYKKALLDLELKQSDLAIEYGCSREWINRILNGKVKCNKTENWLKDRLGLST